MDGGAMLCQVSVWATCAWLGYAILFKDVRDRHLASEAAAEGGLHQLSGWARAATIFLVSLPVYLALLGIPALLLITFVPTIYCAHREGLSPQDISLGGSLGQHREAFSELPALLKRVSAAGDDLSAPAWVEARAYLTKKLNGPRRFDRDVWQALVDWGRGLLKDEGVSRDRQTDAAAARAAMARLVGEDGLPGRLDGLRKRVAGLPAVGGYRPTDPVANYAGRALLLHVFYPNDDVAYLAFSDGLRDRAAGTPGDVSMGVTIVLLLAVFALLVNRGMKLLTVRFLGWALRLRHNPLYRRYEEEAFSPWRFLICSGLVLAATWYLSTAQMEPFYVLTYQHRWNYFAAGVWNTLIGGVLVESLGNVVALVMIRGGTDPMKTIRDNVLVGALSVVLLLSFQNSWFAVATALSLGILQSLALKAMARSSQVASLP